jgi:hypothetical protein
MRILTAAVVCMVFVAVTFVSFEFWMTVVAEPPGRATGFSSCMPFSSWQQQYVRLHADIVAGLAAPQFLIWGCSGGAGGLGSRLNGISSAFQFAVQSNRAFIIQCDWPFPFRTVFEPNSINWFAPVPMNLSLATFNWRDSLTHCQFLSQSPFDTLWPTQVVKLIGGFFPCDLRSSPYHRRFWIDQHTALQFLLRPSKMVSVRLEEFRKGHASSYVIALHLRTGKNEKWIDGPLHIRKTHGNYSVAPYGIIGGLMSWYFDCAKKLGESQPLPVVWLVAADSVHAFRVAADEAKRQGKKIFSVSKGEAQHMERTGATLQNFEDVAVDWNLIGMADAVLMTGQSSFSMTATNAYGTLLRLRQGQPCGAK